jgi:hypothetical protein
MSRVGRNPADPGGRILIYVAFILSAVFFVGCLLATTPAIADETGIKGKVLRGPTVPGPTIAGESDEAPFHACFHVLSSKQVVARFEADENGNFKVLLPPGEYTIIPDASAPIPYPKRQTKDVTVPEDGFAEVTLRFDTGMR